MSQLDILHNFKSENYDLRKKRVEFVILHYTETKNLSDAIKLLTDSKRKVSSHFVIDKNGDIYNLVCETKRAWHAGVSCWDEKKDINSRSIGIEIVNSGENTSQIYPTDQINSLIVLIKYLKKKFSVSLFNILGHSDIAPLRKIDPGKFFPWEKLGEKKAGLWIKNKLSYTVLNTKQYNKLLNNLRKIGYPHLDNLFDDEKNQKVVEAFHRRFSPKLVGKEPTITTLKNSDDLLKFKNT